MKLCFILYMLLLDVTIPQGENPMIKDKEEDKNPSEQTKNEEKEEKANDSRKNNGNGPPPIKRTIRKNTKDNKQNSKG